MLKVPRCPRPLRSLLAKSVVWLIAAVFFATPPLFGYYLYLLDEWQSDPAPPVEPLGPDMFLVVSGIRTPPTKAVEEADLNDEAEVIGVCVGEHARAYVIESMGFPHHVVNDVLGGRAVSVTYCDRRDCARVFTGEDTSAPLDLDMGGWKDDKGMMLHSDGVHYSQETGENLTQTDDAPLPYQQYPHERTTWGSWRKAHPDTDVYAGQPPLDAPSLKPVLPDMILDVSGIRTPPTTPAAEADLKDEAEVIGVCVGEHARAYVVKSMGFPHHVVNDVLGGRAVSVTYCDRRDCARVFTREDSSAPLDLNIGGWKESKGMLLQLAGTRYSQETSENLTAAEGAPLPYQQFPYERTTWRSWRKAHPDSDVYVGPPLG